ncbi:hypothetical protein [Spirillospora sp. NPDC048823]|uniref:hypothetical protein n=1 Tax=unclassified Spirillospora TaxID=2642701 RepID=UPI0037154E25
MRSSSTRRPTPTWGFRAIVVKDHREPGLLPVKQAQITGWGALMTASFVPKPGSRG